jgi:hypothetical protein
MRRHILAARHLVILDGREHAFGVKFLHDDNGAANLVNRHRPAQGRCMIEWGWRQIDAVGIEPVKPHRQRDQRVGDAYCRVLGQRHAHTLGPAGCARRIEHVDARALIGNRRCGHGGDRIFPTGISGDRTAHRIAFDARLQLRGQGRLTGGQHKQLCA